MGAAGARRVESMRALEVDGSDYLARLGGEMRVGEELSVPFSSAIGISRVEELGVLVEEINCT